MKDARGRSEVISLSTVTTRSSVTTVGMSNLVIVFPLITSLSAPVSIMALTTAAAPEDELIMRIGIMGLITLSSALTTHFAVVAASQRIAFGCTFAVLGAVAAACAAASIGAEYGRNSIDSGFNAGAWAFLWT